MHLTLIISFSYQALNSSFVLQFKRKLFTKRGSKQSNSRNIQASGALNCDLIKLTSNNKVVINIENEAMQMGKTNPKAQLWTPFLTPWATIVFNICAAMSMNELIMATPCFGFQLFSYPNTSLCIMNLATLLYLIQYL